MKNEKEIKKESQKNMESIPLDKNKKNEKDKIMPQKNLNNKKEKEEKQNLKKNEKENEIKLSDDDLDHPLPLESDFYEEEKEEIKNNFYQNQLKEKEKLLKSKEIQKNEEDNYLNESNIKVVKKLKEFFDSVSKSQIKKKGAKDNFYSDIKQNNIEIKKEKKKIPQKETKTKEKKIQKIVEKKENISNNILDKQLIKKENKQQNVIIKKVEQNNINEPKKNVVKEKQIKNFSKNPSIQRINKQIKNNQNNKSKKVLNNQIKTIPQPNINNHNSTTSDRLIVKIQKSMDYGKNIFYDNQNNKTLKVEKPKLDEINLQNIEQKERKTQIYNNECFFDNKCKHNELHKIIKMKQLKNKLGIKSQSYSNMNYNKIYYNKIDNINNIGEKMNTQANINKKSARIIPIKKINRNNKSMNYSKNSRKINRIPILLNCQRCINNNKVIKNDLHDNKVQLIESYTNPKKIKEYKENIFNRTTGINNIHNNIGFYNIRRDSFKNDSTRKKTFEIRGKFNNTLTTYVVISKNMNSKLKLIPKSNNTIDYGTEKLLNPIQSVIFPKSINFYNQQPIATYINSEQNVKNNQKFQYFSPYTEESKYCKKIPFNNATIKTNKSHNLLQIKKNYNYTNNENIENNYGNNYKNYVGCSIHNNENMINNNNSLMNSYYNNFNSKERLMNTVDSCENYDYINYGCDNMQNSAYYSFY